MARKAKKASSTRNSRRDDDSTDGDYPITPRMNQASYDSASESESEEGWSDDSGRHSDTFENEHVNSSDARSKKNGPPVQPSRSHGDPSFDRFSASPAGQGRSSSPSLMPRSSSGGLMGDYFANNHNNYSPGCLSEDDDDDFDEPVRVLGGSYLSNRSSRSSSSSYSDDDRHSPAAAPAVSFPPTDSMNDADVDPTSPVSARRYAPSPVNPNNHSTADDDDDDETIYSEIATPPPVTVNAPPEASNGLSGRFASRPPEASRQETFNDEPEESYSSDRPTTAVEYGHGDHFASGKRCNQGSTDDGDLEDQPSRTGSMVESVMLAEAEKRHRKAVTELMICLVCALVCAALMAGVLIGIFVFGKDRDEGSVSTTPPTPVASNDTKVTSVPSLSPVSVSLPPTSAIPNATTSETPAAAPTPAATDVEATMPPSLSNLTGDLTIVTNQELFNTIAALSADGGVAMLTAGTPQSLAFSSVQDEDLDVGNARQVEHYDRQVQRYALRTFFYSTNGPTWTNKSGWEEPVDECLWYSFSPQGMCTDGVVSTLEFVNNNITGTLPNELSMLSGMTKFIIKGVEGERGLTEGIPSTMGTMSNMTDFVLQHHKMKQAVPGQLFKTWSAATTVSLADCNIPGIFPDISGLTSVVELNLSGNRMRGSFPEAAVTLTTLEVLTVADNNLQGSLPTTGLESLTALKYLSVAQNQLTGEVTSQFGKMTSLSDGLDLSINKFTRSIPSELNSLTDLTRLLLSYNGFSGTVPDLSHLTKLKELALEGNELTGNVTAETCTAIPSAAEVSADCNPDGGGEVECSCCTKCCLTTENEACQAAR